MDVIIQKMVNAKYSGIIFNDITAAPGLSVSFFAQGCPHRCPGCHNPETWSFDGGLEFTPDVLENIIQGLTAQNIKRNLCIMGGEPLAPQNTFLTYLII
jgi:anaerobic ribonucleoside-triphosphate reductase activating protein